MGIYRTDVYFLPHYRSRRHHFCWAASAPAFYFLLCQNLPRDFSFVIWSALLKIFDFILNQFVFVLGSFALFVIIAWIRFFLVSLANPSVAFLGRMA
jgi:hypothetical protein